MSKPIKDWTLGELRGLCKALREINCMGCLLKGKICCRLKNTAPCEWDLAEKPILSIEEARIAEDIEAVFPDAEKIMKANGKIVLVGKSSKIAEIYADLFPSIADGAEYTLAEMGGFGCHDD